MTIDLERADRATRAAVELLGRRLPAGYPNDPPAHVEAHVHGELRRRRLGFARRDGQPEGPPPVWERPQPPRDAVELRPLVAGGAVEVLVAAVELEQAARAAQGKAVEALRHAQPHRYPWSKIGELTGVSPQGAFKRWRDVEGPEAQARLEESPS